MSAIGAATRKLVHPWRLPADRLFNEQAKLIVDHLLGGGIVGASALGLLAAVVLHMLFGNPIGYVWLACSWTLNVVTIAVLRRMRSRPLRAATWFTTLAGVFISAGLVWGVLPLLVLNPAEPIPLLLIMVSIITHGAGTYAITSSCMPLFCAYIYPALLPLTIACALSASPLLLALGVLCLIYLVCMTAFAAGAQQAARHSLELQFSNVELVERLRLESLQREQARADAVAANHAKSSFLAAASHDLRQPLHALGLFLDLLAREPLAARQQALLDSAQAVSASAGDMLNMLLDYSRLEAGVVHPRKRAFALQDLLSRLEREFGPMADAKGLVYRSRDTPLAVHADPALTELVLRNLISNALRYTTTGGVLIACRRRGRQVSLEVWDTGIGIAPEDRDRVFQEFVQIGNPERDRRRGLGLGLAIAKRLCQTMELPLLLTSRLGHGSMFRVLLPSAGGNDIDEAVDPGGDDGALEGMRVLVVDDDEDIVRAMRDLFQAWGCECIAAESWSQAQPLLTEPPSLLIVDYRLRQGHTGVDLIAALNARFNRNVPAIIITGDAAPDRLREAQATGAALLHKPVSSRKLRAAIGEVLAPRTGA